MRERMWYYHLESIANFQYFGMEWDIYSDNICHLYTCPTFKGVLSALLFHCIVQVLLSKEVHNHSFPNLPWFVLLETLLRFNKLAKLRSCVNWVHFAKIHIGKYCLENTIWKIQFGKIHFGKYTLEKFTLEKWQWLWPYKLFNLVATLKHF